MMNKEHWERVEESAPAPTGDSGSPAQRIAALRENAHPDDIALTNLERAVASGQLTVNGAITRAYMLGLDRGGQITRGDR